MITWIEMVFSSIVVSGIILFILIMCCSLGIYLLITDVLVAYIEYRKTKGE